MKKAIVLLFALSAVFAQVEYQANLSLGDTYTPNYVIVKDDNLWNLAKKHYGDGFEWRYIWEHNRYIQDPHWIYPGNPLFIPSMRSAQGLSSYGQVYGYGEEIVNSDNVQLYDSKNSLVQITDQVIRYPSIYQLLMVEKYKYFFSLESQRQAPFIYDKSRIGGEQVNVFAYGKIKNKKGHLTMQNKNVVVKTKNSSAFVSEIRKVGTDVDFYTVRKDLRNKKGVVIEPVASGQVKSVEDNYADVYIEKLWGLLRNKAKAAPPRKYKSIGNQLTYKVLVDSLHVRVVVGMRPDMSLKPSETIFIDKGSNNGVSIGDHITLFKQAKKKSKKNRIGKEPIAEGLVVAVEKNTATLRITTAKEYSLAKSLVGIRNGRIVEK
jgi:hypothetical protein